MGNEGRLSTWFRAFGLPFLRRPDCSAPGDLRLKCSQRAGNSIQRCSSFFNELSSSAPFGARLFQDRSFDLRLPHFRPWSVRRRTGPSAIEQFCENSSRRTCLAGNGTPPQAGGDREQMLIAPRKFRKGKSFTSQRGHRIDSRGAPGRQQAGHRSHGKQQRRSGQQNERARALADEVFAPRQQREQLDPEIGNKESSECDRWNAHKRIPE